MASMAEVRREAALATANDSNGCASSACPQTWPTKYSTILGMERIDEFTWIVFAVMTVAFVWWFVRRER
jgi:uncharacterized membrane protein